MPLPELTISEFKEKYPQYADQPSEELAKNLYDKFYSDVSYKDYIESVLPEEEEESFFQLEKGIDYTDAYGPQAVAAEVASGVFEGGADILGGSFDIMPERREAIANIDAFNTYATTRLMQTLAGKENVQLQERLQKLTAKTGMASPAKAKATVNSYLGFLDFSEKATKNLLDSGLLDKKDRIKGKQDLRAIENMKNEYNVLAKQFDRKYGEGEGEGGGGDLTRFFRD